MDFDLFLTSPRWEILQIIAKRPSSPIEIAESIGTTVSYVSQQLKLLDAAGLLVKKKTGASEKGKPRTLFSLSDEISYISTLTRDFSGKNLIKLDDHHKIILKIWASFSSIYHRIIERLFWNVEEHLDHIDLIYIDTSVVYPKLVFVSTNASIKKILKNYLDRTNERIECLCVDKIGTGKIDLEYSEVLYDPKNVLSGLKGGLLKKDE